MGLLVNNIAELKFYRSSFALIFSLLLFPCAQVCCQHLELKGTVLDATTSKPLPFATIAIGTTYRGTTANAKGNFTLIVPYASLSDELVIAYLGYKQKKISISTIKTPLIVKLTSEERVLKEVVIMPDSSLTVFLKEAYNNIKKNYTFRPYGLEGFYREGLKNTEGQYNYFGEVQLLLQTSGYQYNNEDGSVKILRSRINDFTDTPHTYYYRGPFIGCWGDVVKRNPDYLKPNTKEYTYELSDIKIQNGKEIWVVKLKQRKKPFEGNLYIEKESKAYVRIDLIDSVIRKEVGRSRMRRETSVIYRNINDKWFLQYTNSQLVDYSEKYKRNEMLSAEFSVNKVTLDTFQHISVTDRLSYGQPFALLKNDFSPDFWKGSTTLVQDSSLANQIEKYRLNLTNRDSLKTNKSSKNKRKALLNIITRLGFNLGTRLLPYSLKPGPLSLTYTSDGNIYNYRSLRFPEFPLLLVTGYSFKLSKRYDVFLNSATSVIKNYMFKSTAFGLRCSFQLPVKGNPLLLRPGLGYSHHTFGQGFPIINQSEILFNGKKYDYNKMRFYVGEKVSTLQLSFSLDKKLKGRKWFYFNAGYQFELESQDFLFLRKESLFSKLHSIKLNNSETTVIKTKPLSTGSR